MIRQLFILLLTMNLLGGAAFTYAVKPISGSYQKHYSNERDSNHWLILGAIERIKGAVSPEKELRINGKVTKWLWQMPVGTTYVQAFNGLREQVIGESVTLFDCEGRSCGPSNDFANQVFEQSILYGRDSSQLYWVGFEESKSDRGADTVWVLYTTTRSNKRVYAYLEKITLASNEKEKFSSQLAQSDTDQLMKNGFVVLEGMGADEGLSSEQVEWLKTLLESYPKTGFAIVVHLDRKGEVDALLEQSQTKAQALVDQVAAAQGFVQNLYPHGAGTLMPREGVSGFRVEVVKASR